MIMYVLYGYNFFSMGGNLFVLFHHFLFTTFFMILFLFSHYSCIGIYFLLGCNILCQCTIIDGSSTSNKEKK